MELQKMLSLTRKAIDDYSMIEEKDNIAVGVSGGKDSMCLLKALSELRRFYPKKYSLSAVTVDMGFKGADFSPVSEFCRENNIEYRIIKTQIAQIIFDVRKESNPCSLCSKMKRGALDDAIREMGCNKLALGHHKDDVVETLLLNMIYTGNIRVFSPTSYLDRSKITVIRPLIYIFEKDVTGFVKQNGVPTVKSCCPADKNTKRELIKEQLFLMSKESKDVKNQLFGAICRANLNGFS